MKRIKKCGSEGYTIIELLVVMAITALFSSILISYNHTSRQQIAFYAEQTKLIQSIFRAKSLALGSYVGSSASNICGYGVHIGYSEMSYSIFSYSKAGVTDCQGISSINPASENIISTFKLDNNVSFTTVISSGQRLDDVLFIPPQPLTLVGSGGSIIRNGSAAVSLRTLDSSLSASININSAGLIDF
ncbi:MAG: type II secretion system protein [Candidatus Liptonbacteria bacterium]|nr:type II secretion system protein [Candidatus Liptonbacteria bacterium]